MDMNLIVPLAIVAVIAVFVFLYKRGKNDQNGSEPANDPNDDMRG